MVKGKIATAKLSQKSEKKKGETLEIFAKTISSNDSFKGFFSVNKASMRVTFRQSLSKKNLGHFFNLVATVLSNGTVQTTTAMYIAAMSMGWPFKQSDKDSAPIQNSPEDIAEVVGQVTSYLVDDNEVFCSFGLAKNFMQYYLQHDWSSTGNDAVQEYHNTYKEHFTPVVTAVLEKLESMKGLSNENEKTVMESAFNMTIEQTELPAETELAVRLKEIATAETFTEHCKGTGQTAVEALRAMGNDHIDEGRLQDLGDKLLRFDTHQPPPQPQSREVSTVEKFRQGFANEAIKIKKNNRLTNPNAVNSIDAAAQQMTKAVVVGKQGMTAEDGHNRWGADIQSCMTKKINEGRTQIYVEDCVLKSMGSAQCLVDVWGPDQTSHIEQARKNVLQTRAHNQHPIFKVPSAIKRITKVKPKTVKGQFKDIQKGRDPLTVKKNRAIARKIIGKEDVTEEEQATFVQDTVRTSIQGRPVGNNPHLASMDPANVEDYTNFISNHLELQMYFFSVGMPCPPNVWHGVGEPHVDLAEFKAKQVQEFTKNWGLLTVVLNFATRMISEYNGLSSEEKSKACGLSWVRFSRIWQPVVYILLSSGVKGSDPNFIQHVIQYFASIPTRFIASKFEDALKEDVAMKENVRFVLDAMVADDVSRLGKVVGKTTWECLSRHLDDEFDMFMRDPKGYTAIAKDYKAPRPKKAKKVMPGPKPTIKKAPRSGITSKAKRTKKKKEMKPMQDRLRGLIRTSAPSSDVGSSASFYPAAGSESFVAAPPPPSPQN
jgi:hypothetical protein